MDEAEANVTDWDAILYIEAPPPKFKNVSHRQVMQRLTRGHLIGWSTNQSLTGLYKKGKVFG